MSKLKKFIVDKNGQWTHPGQPTMIPDANGRITMQGVPYPVYGMDDQGNAMMMMPGGEYQFPGNSVYEIPMAQIGGDPSIPDLSNKGWLSKYQNGGTLKPKGWRREGVSEEDTLQIQKELNEKGYNLTEDGLWGRRTEQAYQDSLNNLKPLKSISANSVDVPEGDMPKLMLPKTSTPAQGAYYEDAGLERRYYPAYPQNTFYPGAVYTTEKTTILDEDNIAKEFIPSIPEIYSPTFKGAFTDNQWVGNTNVVVNPEETIPKKELKAVSATPNLYRENNLSCTDSSGNIVTECISGVQLAMDYNSNISPEDRKDVLGITGSSWQIGQNIIDKGGNRIYGLTTDVPEGTIQDNQQLEGLLKQKKKGVDLKQIHSNAEVGDIVEMFYQNSPSQDEALAENRGNVLTTHAGIITEKDGVKYVTHNIHGKWHSDKLSDILDGKKISKHLVLASGIVRPNYLLNNDTSLDTLGVQVNPKARVYKSDDPYKTREASETEWAYGKKSAPFSGTSLSYVKGLSYYAPQIQQDFGLSDAETENLMKISFGLFGKESGFGKGETYLKKAAKRNILNVIKDAIPDSLPEGDELSSGPTQIKVDTNFNTPEKKQLLERYGITKDNIWDPQNSAAATMLITALNYEALKHHTGATFDNFNNLTLQNVLGLAHNKGMNAVLQNEFSKSNKRTLGEKVKSAFKIGESANWKEEWDVEPYSDYYTKMKGFETYSNLHNNPSSYANLLADYAASLNINYAKVKELAGDPENFVDRSESYPETVSDQVIDLYNKATNTVSNAADDALETVKKVNPAIKKAATKVINKTKQELRDIRRSAPNFKEGGWLTKYQYGNQVPSKYDLMQMDRPTAVAESTNVVVPNIVAAPKQVAPVKQEAQRLSEKKKELKTKYPKVRIESERDVYDMEEFDNNQVPQNFTQRVDVPGVSGSLVQGYTDPSTGEIWTSESQQRAQQASSEIGRGNNIDPIGLGILTATGAGPAIRTAGAVLPYLDAPAVLPYLGEVPWLTANNVMNAGFAANSVNQIVNPQSDLRTNPNAVNIAETALGLLPIVGPATKLAGEATNAAGNYLTTQTPLKNAYKLRSSVLKENPEVLLHRVQKPGQSEMIEQQATSSPGWGRAFSSDPGDMFYYTSPHIQKTRGYSGDSEILRVKMPRKNLDQYGIENFNASQESLGLPTYRSAKPKDEFILPLDQVRNATRFGEQDLPALFKEYKEFNTPHWWKGYGQKPELVAKKRLPVAQNELNTLTNKGIENLTSDELIRAYSLENEINKIKRSSLSEQIPGSPNVDPELEAIRKILRKNVTMPKRYKPSNDWMNETFLKSYPEIDKGDQIMMSHFSTPEKAWSWYNRRYYGVDYDKNIPRFKDPMNTQQKKGGSIFQNGGQEMPFDLPLISANPGSPWAYESPQANGYLLPDPNRPELLNTGATEYKMGVEDVTVPTVVNGQYMDPDQAYQRYMLTGEKFKPMVDPSSYSQFYDTIGQLGLMKQKKGGSTTKNQYINNVPLKPVSWLNKYQ